MDWKTQQTNPQERENPILTEHHTSRWSAGLLEVTKKFSATSRTATSKFEVSRTVLMESSRFPETISLKAAFPKSLLV